MDAGNYQRRQVIYTGHVQGVGFRHSTSRIASRYSVTGFVLNLPDRSVELLVEGTDEELTAFLSDVDARLSQHIRNTAVDRRPATGEFRTFEIRYY